MAVVGERQADRRNRLVPGGALGCMLSFIDFTGFETYAKEQQ
jgi:hypothetical protein